MNAPDKARRQSAKARIQAHLLAHPLRRFTLPEMATIGGCMESAASARWREIAQKWEGFHQEIRPGLFVYWLTGYRAMPLGKKSPRDVALDELRADFAAALADLRAQVQRLQTERHALPYVVPEGVGE